eukprot:Opistho-2@13005
MDPIAPPRGTTPPPPYYELYKDAMLSARNAVAADTVSRFTEAHDLYVEAVGALLRDAKVDTDAARSASMRDVAKQYINRAEAIAMAANATRGASTNTANGASNGMHNPASNMGPNNAQRPRAASGPPARDASDNANKSGGKKSTESSDAERRRKSLLDRAEGIYRQGCAEEASGDAPSALEHYKQAASVFLECRKFETEEARRKEIESIVDVVLKKAEKLASAARAVPAVQDREGLSGDVGRGGRSVSPQNARVTSLSVLPGGASVSGNVPGLPRSPRMGAAIGPSGPSTAASSSARLTPAEIEVLRTTSSINARQFVPWLQADVKEKYAYGEPFCDPDGLLKLAPKQEAQFKMWARPSEFCVRTPSMIHSLSAYSIRQTVVSDCSFVASLSICAEYEKKFARRLVTGIIFPQDARGNPVYNPSGKYVVKLNINGVARKVIIDDRLPVDARGRLLCSYSNDGSELWVSLIEKAYLKVNGGYDWPGSNSSIDMYALTGWIPERMPLKKGSFDSEKVWRKLNEALKLGYGLVTVATGPLSESEAERTGLVPTHAYCVLDVKEAQNTRFVQLKNPWSHLRWKGRFSEKDDASWTPELRRLLDYDQAAAVLNDNGVFYIDWETLCHFFDVIYVSWNPELFKHSFSLHSCWSASTGPKKDLYNLGHNPQYTLDLPPMDKPEMIWVLLTKHITDKDDFADNKDFITVHVYKSNQGGRVYYPDDPLIEGVKINSPHYLVKVSAAASKERQRFTLVISQYEKNNTINYTLRAYANAPFTLHPVKEPYTHEHKLTGQWTADSAGGCANWPTFPFNPQFRLCIRGNADEKEDKRAHVMIVLQAPKQYAAGITVARGRDRIEWGSDPNVVECTKKLRHGFVCTTLRMLPGEYAILPSTFNIGDCGAFFLTVKCSHSFELLPMKPEGAGMHRTVVAGSWVSGSSAAGCPNFGAYAKNPTFALTVSKPTRMFLRLTAAATSLPAAATKFPANPPSLNVAVFPGTSVPRNITGEVAESGVYKNPARTPIFDVAPRADGYVVVPSTFDPFEGQFTLIVYSEEPVTLRPL